MISPGTARDNDLSLRRVLLCASAIIRRHAAGFAIVTFVAVFLPTFFADPISDALGDALDAAGVADRIGDAKDLVDPLVDLVPDAVTFLGKVLLDGTAVLAAVDQAPGTRPRFLACLRDGLRLLPKNLAVSALVLAASALGSLLLLLPGLLLQCAWIAAVPLATAERTGIIAALDRSWSLTAGRRWRILGLVIPYLVAFYGVHMLEGDVPSPLALHGMAVRIAGTLGAALDAVLAVVASAGLAALYRDLDRLRHAIPTRDLVAAFD